MAWEVFKREDTFQRRDEPFVSIRSDHFGFSATFVRLAGATAAAHVTVHVDYQNRRLGFEFHAENRRHSFALARQYNRSARQASPALQCTAVGLLRKYPWLRSVSRLPANERRFVPHREGNLWVIQLCPAFEERKARESADIPTGARGVYRYLRENGEIVYIGRGEIRKRLAAPERADWDFDRVEYSVVVDPDQQVKWETYWIERFKDNNSGKLPFYNRVSGSAFKEERDA